LPAYVEAVERSLTRIEGMRKLVTDLLDVTHIESGQRRRHLAMVDLAQMARGVLETFAPETAAKRIEIACHAPEPVQWSPIAEKSR
jgi:two-component system, sensor histidine kinase and response regulator